MSRTTHEEKNTLTAFMLVNKLTPEYWKNEVMQQCIARGDISGLLRCIGNLLFFRGCRFQRLDGIVHNRDVNESGAPAEPHIHIFVQFEQDSGLSLSLIARTLSVKPEQIEKPKKGRYAVDNMLSYLIHAKDSDKYQYSPYEVISLVGEPFVSVYERKREEWERGRKAKDRAKYKARLPELMYALGHYQIKRERMYLDRESYEILVASRKKPEEVIEDANRRRAALTTHAMLQQKLSLNRMNIYVYGDTGAGKSLFCERLADYLIQTARNQGIDWDLVSLGGKSSPLDEYEGQEIIILDDWRSNKLSKDEWLRLLDPYRPNVIGARYNNRRCISRINLMSCMETLPDFFQNFSQSENINQFLRRFSYVVECRVHGEALEVRFAEVKKLNVPEYYTPLYSKPVYLKYSYKCYSRWLPAEEAVKALGDLLVNEKIQNWGVDFLTGEVIQVQPCPAAPDQSIAPAFPAQNAPVMPQSVPDQSAPLMQPIQAIPAPACGPVAPEPEPSPPYSEFQRRYCS